jgi:hypothetical protein
VETYINCWKKFNKQLVNKALNWDQEKIILEFKVPNNSYIFKGLHSGAVIRNKTDITPQLQGGD